LEKGFLAHIRGWLQISLDSVEKDSNEERHFRFVLLQQIDALKDYISPSQIKTSRLNKVMLRCSGEDSGHNRKLATDLFDRFCNSISSSPQSQTQQLSPVRDNSASGQVIGQAIRERE
jgi:hypothetical protein